MAIGEGVRRAFEEVLVPAGMGDISIYTEMGRFILGPYGALVAKCIHHKHTYKEYAGLDACAANLMRPAMYGAYHHITVLGKENALHDRTYDVTGGLDVYKRQANTSAMRSPARWLTASTRPSTTSTPTTPATPSAVSYTHLLLFVRGLAQRQPVDRDHRIRPDAHGIRVDALRRLRLQNGQAHNLVRQRRTFAQRFVRIHRADGKILGNQRQ